MSSQAPKQRSRERGGAPTRGMKKASAAILAVLVGCSYAQGDNGAPIRVDDPSQICMVTNRYMGTAQIPVSVEGHTYYGCCSGCAARLQGDPSLRLAKDPITGREVDKARSVPGRLPDGRVLYFESAETLSRFRG